MACKDCFRGFVHPDTDPTGRVEKVHGLDTYIAEPEGAIKGIVVIVPDAFGWEFINNRVLADTYAKKGGFRVYLPDFMNGGAPPVWTLDYTARVMSSESWANTLWKPYYVAHLLAAFIPFLAKHRFPHSWPPVRDFFVALRANEAASLPLGAAGFCWGGKHTIILAHGEQAPNGVPLIDAGFTAHPSALTFPDDLQKVKKPVSVAIGDRDLAVKFEKAKEMQKLLKEAGGEDAEVRFYPGAGHGFAVRADPGDKAVIRHAEDAEDQAIEWFQKYFGKTRYQTTA